MAQVKPNDVDCPGGANDIRDRVRLEEPALVGEPGFYVTLRFGPAGGPFAPYGSGLCFATGSTAVVEAGDRVQVEAGATFSVLTPLVGALTGNPIPMSASAEVEVQG